MGALFARPLTREDLREELEPIRTGLQEVRTDLQEVKDALLAEKGDLLGKKCTVFVRAGGLILGHGLIGASDGKYFFITAAHVVVGELCQTDGVYDLCWGSDNTFVIRDATFLNPQVTENYVKFGEEDIGCVEIEGLSPHAVSEFQDQLKKIITTEIDLVGKTVVGHGRIFLRGTVTNTSGSRSMVNTSSVPGCSGCLLFDNHERFVGVVHGDMKHRAGNHRDILERDITAKANFFSDSPHQVRLLKIPDGTLQLKVYSSENRITIRPIQLLQMAEIIDGKLLAKPDSVDLYLEWSNEKRDIETSIFHLDLAFPHDQQLTLNGTMDKVFNEIWKERPAAEVNSSERDEGLVVSNLDFVVR